MLVSFPERNRSPRAWLIWWWASAQISSRISALSSRHSFQCSDPLSLLINMWATGLQLNKIPGWFMGIQVGEALPYIICDLINLQSPARHNILKCLSLRALFWPHVSRTQEPTSSDMFSLPLASIDGAASHHSQYGLVGPPCIRLCGRNFRDHLADISLSQQHLMPGYSQLTTFSTLGARRIL